MHQIAIDVLEQYAHGGTWWLDLDGEQLWWSPGIYRLHGVDPQTYTPTLESALAFYEPESRQRLDAYLAGDADSFDCEYRLCLPERPELWIRETGRQFKNSSGTLRIVGTLADIDARRRSVQAVQESRRRLERTLRHAPIGMALVSTQGRWLTVNQALCDMLGYSETELLELTFQDITHPDDLEADLTHVDDLLAGRARVYSMEKRYFHKQGHIVDIELRVSLLRDTGGEPLYFISHIQDITVRRREHRALFEAKELAEVTFEAIGEGLIRIDQNGDIEEANTAAHVMLIAEPNTLVGQRFADVIALYEAESQQQLPDPATEVLSRGERLRVPLFTRLRRFDGHYISIADSVSPIHSEDGGRSRYHLYQSDSETVAHAAEYINTAELLQSGLEQNRFTLYLQAIVDARGAVQGYFFHRPEPAGAALGRSLHSELMY